MSATDLLTAVSGLFTQGSWLHGAALLAFCTFLGFQLYLYFTHRRALVRQSKALAGLRNEGRVPEQPFSRDVTRNEWLGWVATRFQDRAFQDGQYGREDAVEQLDHWLESNTSYLLLQRAGIVAPMVGLLVTVAGFLFLDPVATTDWDLKQILHALSPIVLGLGIGAVLTIINHFLLHMAGKKTDSVRSTACRWFDDCVWKHVQAKPRVAADDAAGSLQAMAETIRESIEPYRGATAAIGQTSQSLQGAGAALVETVERLRADTAAIPEEMQSLRGTASSVIRSLGEIVPNIEHVTSELAESVGAFKSVVQEQFGQAAGRHRESAELLAGSVGQIHEAIGELGAQFGSFAQAVHAQAAAGQEWSRSLRDDVLPAQRAFQQAGAQLTDATRDLGPAQRTFREAADSMRGSADGLAAFVREGIDPATQRLAELDGVLKRMQETTEAVRQMTQLRQEFASLARNMSQAAEAAEAIRALPQEIRAVLETIASSHNGHPSPKRPLFLRLLGRIGLGRHSNHNGSP